MGQQPYTAVGKSSIPVSFDAAAEANLKAMLASATFWPNGTGGNITDIRVQTSAPSHGHAYAGTTNSECRSPGDDFYPVQTRIDISFPSTVTACGKDNFMDCILLDPTAAIASTIDNAASQGVAMPANRTDPAPVRTLKVSVV